MSHDDEVCLKLGREIVRMIREVKDKPAQNEVAYSRRKFTFPGGAVWLLIASDAQLVDLMETAAQAGFNVETVTPQTQRN